MVQRRAARLVTSDYRHKSSVTEMIANLDRDFLQKRRGIVRPHLMFGIVHGLVNIPKEPYLTPSASMTRDHDSRCHQNRTPNTNYQHSFSPRTIVLFNQLPQTAVCQTTLEAFRINWPPSPSERHTMVLTFYPF